MKSFYVGKDHVGDVPLSKKIFAGLTTGEDLSDCLLSYIACSCLHKVGLFLVLTFYLYGWTF